jgi:ribosomal protein S18 acetylase RimI-like enzyme
MITFTEAQVGDIPLLRDIAASAWAPTYGNILSPDQLAWMFEWMYSPESLKRQMVDEGQRFFIASADGVPCGYISVERQGPVLFHFQKIYVNPAFQGKGVGRALIAQGVGYIRTLGVAPFRVELNVNRANPAVGFYRRMGFEIAAEGDFAIGHGYFMNDYIMAQDFNN